jgi:hypothetical protein
VKNRPHTSAYLAAQIIGKKGYTEAEEILKKRLRSEDNFLSGECMVALARLSSRDSIPVIQNIILRTNNPRLIIHGAAAFEIFRDTSSIPILLKKLEIKTSPFLRDEIILSIAGILGISEWFYPYFASFLEGVKNGLLELKDYMERNPSLIIQKHRIRKLFETLPHSNKMEFSDRAADLLKELAIRFKEIDVSSIFSASLKDERLTRLERFCFLIAAIIVWFNVHTK